MRNLLRPFVARALVTSVARRVVVPTVAVWSLVAPGCHSGGGAEAPLDAGADRRADGGTKSGAVGGDGGAVRAPSASSPTDVLGSVYPREVTPHPLAVRLCEALHAFPARRKAECCGGEPAPLLMAECTRILSATLQADTVALEERAVDRCAVAMTESHAGCSWVTPSAAVAPELCQGLLRGKLEHGSACRSSLECAGDLHCEGVSPTKSGVCTPAGGAGAGCGTHVDALATYLLDRHIGTSHPFCAEHCSLVTHKCGPPPAIGAACVADVNCASTQRCIHGRCSASPPAQRGESCRAARCAEGLRCADAVCAPLAATGETCSADAECTAGACVRGGEGRSTCGAQCSASFDALHAQSGGPVLGLPKKPRVASPRVSAGAR